MTACPQCGTVAKPNDKFCNTCGLPLPGGAPMGGFGPPPQQGGFAPPPQQGGFGAPQGFQPPPGAGGAPAGPARCQMGHEIAPGASYCNQGHPIALDAMQFANDQYGGGGAFGGPPPPQYGGPQPGFGGPPPQPGFGGPQPMPPTGHMAGYGDPNAPQGFGGPQPGFGGPPQPGFGGPPPQPGFGAPGPQPGFGAPPGPQPGFGGPPPGPQPGYGAPPPVQGQAPTAGGGYEPAPAPANVPPDALRGFLISYQTSPAGDFWPLKGGRKTVGRANSGEGVDIPLADATISSRHAAIVVDAVNGTIAVEDTGSTNGTFVNEEHLGFNGRRDLKDGDRIRFGGYTTIVKVIQRI
jgi:pSer/pThr/pTyr-binding forkhead associated (FHA) protein